MRLTGLREVARYLGIGHQTARKYSSNRKRYPDFPEPVERKGPGSPSVWESGDIDSWQARRPGGGGGHLRVNSRDAAIKGWATRRANEGSAVS